jgi:uncharacterized protein
MHVALVSRVDPWRAADAGKGVCGALAVERVPRLAAHAAPEEPLQVRIGFERDDGSGVRLQIRVRGRYRFTCQRCLSALALEREDSSQVLVVADEATARALEADAEVLVSPPGQMLDLAALVEDEVLLALPFAPRHEPEQCRLQWSARPPVLEQERENPFAVLDSLRRGRREDSQ